MIENIRKRDGRLVPFELDKIAGAIYKAFQACSSKYELKTALDIAKKVEKNLEKKTKCFTDCRISSRYSRRSIN